MNYLPFKEFFDAQPTGMAVVISALALLVLSALTITLGVLLYKRKESDWSVKSSLMVFVTMTVYAIPTVIYLVPRIIGEQVWHVCVVTILAIAVLWSIVLKEIIKMIVKVKARRSSYKLIDKNVNKQTS